MSIANEDPNRVPGGTRREMVNDAQGRAPGTAGYVTTYATVSLSETEVDHLRQPGQLVFSNDNEIMSVPVAAGETIHPGDVVDFDDNGFAKAADPATFNRTNGYGVCIHEGVVNPGADGAVLVQICTGNAYVVCTANADTIRPFRQLALASGGRSILVTEAGVGIDASNRLADGVATFTDGGDATANEDAVDTLNAHARLTVGRYYGLPGGMVRPLPSLEGEPIVIRLGAD